MPDSYKFCTSFCVCTLYFSRRKSQSAIPPLVNRTAGEDKEPQPAFWKIPSYLGLSTPLVSGCGF